MNPILNQTQIRNCEICDKTIKIDNKSKHTNSKVHKHKEKKGTVVKEYELINADIDSVNYIVNDVIEDCREKIYFLPIDYMCL